MDFIKIWERQRSMTPDNTCKNDLSLLIDFLQKEIDMEFRIKCTHDVLGSEKFKS